MTSYSFATKNRKRADSKIANPLQAWHGGIALSGWSKSTAKRVFDVACVICALPFATPLLLLTGLAVRLTSRGPILFRQQRVGRGGRRFTIYKFRTMPVPKESDLRSAVTTSKNQEFTPVGPCLRKWKLDELPQIFNVLRGDMSIVGPRPKLPKHQISILPCRPGITGNATLAFACEEAVMTGLSGEELEEFYQSVVLPLKERLDQEYMSGASCRSDLCLIMRSVFRKWNGMENPEFSTIAPLAKEPVGLS